MEPKSKFWIVSEFFYPEETTTSYILTNVANKLSQKYDVHVICGPNYSSETEKSYNFNLSGDVNVKRVSSISLNKKNLFLRLLRFLQLSFKLSMAVMGNVRKNDKVLIVTNPALLLIFIAVVKKIKGFTYYILVHDVFPENTIPANVIKSPKSKIYILLKHIFDISYKKADRLIVLGRDMKNIIEGKISDSNPDRIKIIENWSDSDQISPQSCTSDRIVFQYAGNYGRVQGIMPLLQIIKNVGNPNICFSFWGNGVLEDAMRQFVDDNNIGNVEINGSYKREEQNSVLSKCNVSIITLADGMYGLGVPSKTYNILASGKAILFIGDLNSEVALMVAENNIGYCYDSKDFEGLTKFFETIGMNDLQKFEEMGRRARELAVGRYSRESVLEKYLSL